MSAEWWAFGLTVIAMLAGTAVNVFLVGRWIGASTAQISSLASTQDDHADRIEALERSRQTEAAAREAVIERLKRAEEAAQVLWRVRDDFVAMKAASEVENRHTREKLEAVARSQAEIARQLANMVTTRAAPMVLSRENGGPQG